MNIFAVHKDPVIAAQSLVDKHVSKMPTESAQMLSNIYYIVTGKNLGYEHTKSIMGHPCTKWAYKSIDNFMWLIQHAEALLDEHVYRYKHVKHHGPRAVIWEAKTRVKELNLPALGLTPFSQSFGEYNHLRCDDPVIGYRRYYQTKKWMGWHHNRPAPDWL